MRTWATFMLLVFTANLSACSGDGKSKRKKSALEQYEEALEELLDEDYMDAAEAFETLAASTLNPVIAQMATLRLADALFFQSKYAEAAEVYREFLVQFSNSSDAPHAIYMRGSSFVERMPENVWLLPPAESRELEDVEQARQAMTTLVDRYPGTYYSLRAQTMLLKCLARLCENHLYIARFYESRNRPLAVVQRLEQALALEEAEKAASHLPESFTCASSQEGLLLMARAFYKLKDSKGIGWVEVKYRKYQANYADPAPGLAEILRLQDSLKSAAETPKVSQ